MAWMYILECGDGSYYVGSTVSLEQRFAQHQNGEGCEYTAERRPVRLVYSEEHQSVRDAFAREQQVKGWRRAKKEALIQGTALSLPSLARAYDAWRVPSTGSGSVGVPSTGSGNVGVPSTGSGTVGVPSTGSGTV